MLKVSLAPMTEPYLRCVYDGLEQDPQSLASRTSVPTYCEEWGREYLSRQASLGHVLLVILFDGLPAGEVKLHNISRKKHRCDITLTLKKEAYRGLGYGTEALRQAIAYAKDTLGMTLLCARTPPEGGRAKRLLRKLGFFETSRDLDTVYYEKDLTREEKVLPISLLPMTEELYRRLYLLRCEDAAEREHRQRKADDIAEEESAADLEFSLFRALNRRMFVVVAEETLLGEISLRSVNEEEGSAVVECAIRVRFQNRGYGKQAIRLLLRYAKCELLLTTAKAVIEAKDTRARHVLEAVGFTEHHRVYSTLYYERRL